MLSSRFSFLGIGSSNEANDSLGVSRRNLKPSLSVQTDKDVYRPGDSIFVTIEVGYSPVRDHESGATPSILIEKLSFEVKGVEQLDLHWFSTQKPSPGSKGRRGTRGIFVTETVIRFIGLWRFSRFPNSYMHSHTDTHPHIYTLSKVGLYLVSFCGLDSSL